MFAPRARGAFVATGETVPGITIPVAGFALPCAGWFNSVEMTWSTAGIIGGGTIAGVMALCAISAENAPASFGVI